MRAVLSNEPVSSIVPSGLNAIARTRPSCTKGEHSGLPSAAFQIRAVLSKLAVATVRPLGANAAARIPDLCIICWPIGRRVATSQS